VTEGSCSAAKSQRASVASYSDAVPSSPILVTMMKEALSSSETSVLTRVTRRNIPEDAISQVSIRHADSSEEYATTHRNTTILRNWRRFVMNHDIDT
jgi:hypothetical protein